MTAVSGNTTPTMTTNGAANNSVSSNNGTPTGASTAPPSAHHWSHKKHESILDVSHMSQLELEKYFLSKLSGGSDNGQFVVYLAPTSDKTTGSNVKYLTQSRIIDGEILLEVEDTRISGYTLYDVVDLVLKLYRTQKSIRFRSVKSSSTMTPTGSPSSSQTQLLPLDLRSYLDARFQKGSIDYDLQQVIRENVYMRTVPCTTRAPRNGEINGQDYIFLSDEQFLELEQNGDLLEYGVYNGHYYGTPKPPKRTIQFVFQSPSSSSAGGGQVPDNLAATVSSSSSPKNNIHPSYEPDSDFDSNLTQQQQQQTNNNNLTPNGTNNNNNNGNNHLYQNQTSILKHQQQHDSSLPSALNNNNNINTSNNTNNNNINNNRLLTNSTTTNNTSPSSSHHTTPIQTTPNTAASVAANSTSVKNSNNSGEEVIPYGWEKVEDPEYGTFYIDHINKQTTYENPLLQQQQQQQDNNQQSQSFKASSSMRTFKPSTSSLNSTGGGPAITTTATSSSTTSKYTNGSSMNGGGVAATTTSEATMVTTPTLDIMTGTATITSTSSLAGAAVSNPSATQYRRPNQPPMKTTATTPNPASSNFYFTQNPDELRGEFIKTSLLKTSHGFGFTIIGANETSEDFLQIKYIVPDGAADRDGLLRQGDVLVYVNNECVLGYTHQDVVEIFQAIPVGQCVELTVCRGYPLSIDPNDPNIEIMPLAAINNPYPNGANTNGNHHNHHHHQHQHHHHHMSNGAPLAAVDELTASTLLNSSSNGGIKQPLMQSPLSATNGSSGGGVDAAGNLSSGSNDEYYCEEYEELYASIIKGPKGFGFTIADDSQMNHQKVKQILDKERCVLLRENDILLEINGVDLRQMSHNQVVDLLKECVRGQETIIKLKRRKYQIVLPQPPLGSSLLINHNNTNNPTTITSTSAANLMSASSPGYNSNVIQQSNDSSSSFAGNGVPLEHPSSSYLHQLDTNGVNNNNSSSISNGLKTNGHYGGESNNDGADFRSVPNKPDTLLLNNNNSTTNNNQLAASSTNNTNTLNNNTNNSNQVAFNYERRAKTPNILQSTQHTTTTASNGGTTTTTTSTNSNGQAAGMNGYHHQHRPGVGPTTVGMNGGTGTNGTYQLRSKTPTTDRMLFSNNYPNDYLYLNGAGAGANSNGKPMPTTSSNNVDQLYSTVSSRAGGMKMMDQIDNGVNTMVISQRPQPNNNNHHNNRHHHHHQQSSSHVPIYDSTTNIQHQRVMQHGMKPNHSSMAAVNPNLSRSKTPGPDMIYFRNDLAYPNGNGVGPAINGNGIVGGKSATISATAASRSKTPTADIMYYPTTGSHRHEFSGTQSVRQPMRSSNLFDAIYQPFNNPSDPQQVNSAHMYMNNQPGMGGGVYNDNAGGMDMDIDDDSYLIPLIQQRACTLTSDVDGNFFLEMTIDLVRHDSGFGFRIVGGEEEGSQVAVGFIVAGGAAHLDGRLRPNDEIVMIDDECVLGATHRRVVQLMTIAGLHRRVKLMVRRKLTIGQYKYLMGFQQQANANGGGVQQTLTRPTNSSVRVAANGGSGISPSYKQPQALPSSMQNYPYTITLFRNGNEGFGFVIISTVNKNGPTIAKMTRPPWIGKIVENSPAERCKRLNVGDRILAVNGINITQMNHLEIVKLIKESGNSITLTIGAPIPDDQPYFSEGKAPLQTEFGTVNNKYANGSDKARSYLTSPAPIIGPSTPSTTKAIINQNDYHVIELRKPQSGGFGFSIRGGKEFNIPLFVLKLADQGPAAMDGRLQVGDQILEINGYDAYQMTHSEAIERIKSGGNYVTLLIRRTGLPPPSITDIIAANSSTTTTTGTNNNPSPQQSSSQLPPSLSINNLNSNGVIMNGSPHDPNAMLIQQQSATQLRAKSPYLPQSVQIQQQQQQQQPVKHFSSSGALINRNY